MRLFGKRIGKKAESSVWSSRAKVALGAAGLLLFIVGVKRSYRLEDAAGTVIGDGAEGRGNEAESPTEGAEGR